MEMVLAHFTWVLSGPGDLLDTAAEKNSPESRSEVQYLGSNFWYISFRSAQPTAHSSMSRCTAGPTLTLGEGQGKEYGPCPHSHCSAKEQAATP